MRPRGPLPRRSSSATPSSRANRRIAGLACTIAADGAAGVSGEDCAGALTRGCAGGGCGAGDGVGWGAGGTTVCVAALSVTPLADAPSPDTVINTDPSETVSPTRTLTSLTTPASLDGTSIDAFSLSSTTSGA